MKNLTISIPDSVREWAESLAREDGVSWDDFVSLVLAQRVAIAEADSYIKIRGRRGSAEQMLDVLNKAPKVEPAAHDRLDSNISKNIE